jgi:catechol 2,3-dioxygenase-like lactoylglutathione lyase family enzyme
VDVLRDKNAMATVAVKDMKAARAFYEGTLGLERVHEEGDDAVAYRTGRASLLVYVSAFAGTNRATTVTWEMGDDLEAAVRALKDKGVRFEHYDDLPGTTRTGDIHVAGTLKNAWFKDPEGNVHALVSA